MPTLVGLYLMSALESRCEWPCAPSIVKSNQIKIKIKNQLPTITSEDNKGENRQCNSKILQSHYPRISS